MLFASIDIGSNAVRLLFANAYELQGKPIVEKATLIRIPVRLGMDVFKSNVISDKKIKMLIKTLKAFKLLIDVYKPVGYCAYATAAMREAKNRKVVLKKIEKKTGLAVELIDGIEEANIIKELNSILTKGTQKKKMYIDVGGGSTDISLIEGKKIIDSKSFNIGTIRLLEEKVKETEWEKLNAWLEGLKDDFGNIFCIGTGGNINKIGKLYGDPINFNISYKKLKESYNYLKGFTLEERVEKLGMQPDRADVIIPAVQIYLTIMKQTGINSIYIPRIGLADGLIYKLYNEHKKKIGEGSR